MSQISGQENSPSNIDTGSRQRLHRLARVDQERLYAGLESFVNLGDAVEDAEKFLQMWPSFCPVTLIDSEKERRPVSAALHQLIIYFRNDLRHVWQGHDTTGWKLSILLGLKRWGDAYRPFIPEMDSFETWGFSACELAPQNLPNWRTGRFEYCPVNDFQTAVYLLFKASWRAKMCAQCSAFFVAAKPGRMYCKPACSNTAKLERNRDWWSDEGKKWRAKRHAKQVRRKRGK